MATKGDIPKKQDFLSTIKDHLADKGLEVSDLQVNLRSTDIDSFVGFIGDDWYTFGQNMEVSNETLDKIKESGKNKPGQKRKLLEYLIEHDKARYEDIVYGLYSKMKNPTTSISQILDYLLENRQPETEIPTVQGYNHGRERRIPHSDRPWQSYFNERKKNPPERTLTNDINIYNYQTQFYDMLWFEEYEHMVQLSTKCNGWYKMFIYDADKVPPNLQDDMRNQSYGYISGPSFTDDKIEYATQASDGFHILTHDGKDLGKGLIHKYNFAHLENRMYVCFPKTLKALKHIKPDTNGYYDLTINFEVKHSYFDHLQHATSILPPYVVDCLLPERSSFSSTRNIGRDYSEFPFMRLDVGDQRKALEMITSIPLYKMMLSCLPPILLYGPFGTGKSRILARAAYEVIMHGITEGKCTRVLICAHHRESVDSFIHSYFGRIEKTQHLQFSVIQIRLEITSGAYRHLCMSMNEFSEKSSEIKEMKNVLIIATYTMSLNLHQYLSSDDGFFTHLFLDEAAQVREPEAIIPLAMATRDAKIVLAGDDKQVGPRTLVLGDQARKCGLHISLLERLMNRYEKLKPHSNDFVTKLSMNYRSHESLIAIPQLLYPNLRLHVTPNMQPWEHKGPTGYKFVCSDSRLVPSNIDPNHQLVEACIVLEQVLSYLEKVEKTNPRFRLNNICVITSTRKQLNQIKEMAFRYKSYEKLKGIRFLTSFMIQGHEFEAIFLSLLEPLQYDKEMFEKYFTKSLFNRYVFNTVITRARSHVVAVGKPVEILSFEDEVTKGELQCWHGYIKFCMDKETLFNLREEAALLHEKLKITQKDTLTVTPSQQKSTPPEPFAEFTPHGKHKLISDELSATCIPKSKVENQDSPVTSYVVTPIEHFDQWPDLFQPVSPKNYYGFPPLTQKLPDKSSDLQDECKRLKHELEELQKAKIVLEENLNTEVLKLEEEIKLKESLKANFKCKVDQLETEKLALMNDNKSLKHSNEALQNDMETKLKSKTVFKCKVDQLKTEKFALMNDNESLKHSNEALQKDIKDMGIKLKAKTVELETEKVKLKEKEAANDKLRSQVVKTNIELSELKELKDTTKDVGIQFDYLLDLPKTGLHNVHVAGKKTFFINKAAQLIDMDDYGIKINVLKETAPFETIEVAVVVLVGGQFKFSNKKKLVSAIYGISLSKPIHRPLQLQIQHCVDISSHTKNLSFAIAPTNTPTLPYKFKTVEGGKFIAGSYYGSIERKEFSLVCVLFEEENGDSDDENDTSTDDENGTSTDDDSDSKEKNHEQEEETDSEHPAISGSHDYEEPQKSDSPSSEKDQPTGSKKSSATSSMKKTNASTVSKSSTRYTVMVYYEDKQCGSLVTFAATKTLNALLTYIKNEHPHARKDQRVGFSFTPANTGVLTLNLGAPQGKMYTGWTLEPHCSPCKLLQNEIDNFGLSDYPEPPLCLISVYYSKDNPETVPVLHYGIPLEGISDPVIVYIHLEKSSMAETKEGAVPNQGTNIPDHQEIDPAKAKKAFRKVYAEMLKLMSVATNRLELAAEFYSEELITEASYDEVVDDGPRTDSAKGTSLMKALKETINSNPQLLQKLVSVLDQVENFKFIAEKLQKLITDTL